MTLKTNLLAAAAAILFATGSASALDLGLGGGGDVGTVIDNAVSDLGGIVDIGGDGSAGGNDAVVSIGIGDDNGTYASIGGDVNGSVDESGRFTIDNGNGSLIQLDRTPGSTGGGVHLGGANTAVGNLPDAPGLPGVGGNGGGFGNGGLLGLIFGNGNAPGGGSGGAGGAGGAGGSGTGIGNGGVGAGGGGGGIGAAFYALPARQQQAMVNRCADVLVRPRMYEPDLLELCRFLAQQQQASQAQYRR